VLAGERAVRRALSGVEQTLRDAAVVVDAQLNKLACVDSVERARGESSREVICVDEKPTVSSVAQVCALLLLRAVRSSIVNMCDRRQWQPR